MEFKKDLLHNISLGALVGTIAAVALLVVPITNSFVSDTKAYLSFYVAIIMIGLFLAQSVKRRAFEFILSPLVVSMFFFGLAVGASTFFTNKYPVEGLIGLGGVLIASSTIAVLAGSTLPKRITQPFLSTLAITSALLTVSSALQLIGFGPANLINAIFGSTLPTNMLFNLTGSALVASQFILVSLVGVVSSVATKKHINKIFAITLPIMVIGLLLHGWALLPGKVAALQLPSWTASWSVALDTIRSPRAALIGAGPATYKNVYSIFKPAWTNATPQWAVIYNQAANAPLTILTTLGFFGLITWVLFGLKSISALKVASTENKPIAFMLLVTVGLQLLLPINVVMLLIQALLVAALVSSERDKYSIARFKALSVKIISRNQAARLPSKENTLPLYLGAGVGFVAVVALSYIVGRSYMAFMHSHQASKAAAADDAVAVYEHQQAAVTFNPYLDSFRRNYAVTNLLIASALSNKAELSEAETTQVGELLQQAVREARSATLLDESDSENWATLAEIYQNMIGVSEDAPDWAVQAYVTAIETNPTDPALRLSLGSIFYRQESFSQAASIFQQAVNIKPDFAPAQYNLAGVLVKLEDWNNARVAYQSTLQLLNPDTEEYKQVMEELRVVDEKIAELQAAVKAQQGQGGTTPLSNQVNTPSITDQAINGGTDIQSDTTEDVDLTAPPAEAATEPTVVEEASPTP